ncbi:ATP-dependent RecD-like DNA helicase [Kitasatospora sp. DSM 101779]|uniref:SF1B family DNA helicase RecD2 n=1 Tax=Kitasatospora sp. DSM 101779 TaxID=2853165 RepID=UPI0021DB3DE4|nr:ATP-dependent RecD-like DNA helicase [Kitasatospora sp. DSM 101779]MCU7827176.1 ATP-dependent RecD-like DNA helicase [Kitasatospora sp. DSM 101779]
MAEQQLETVDGIVERILYVSSGGFTALRLGLEHGGSLTAKGEALLGVQPGETLQLTGRRGRHLAYGEEFHAVECRYLEPATLQAIRKYLASGLVRGIGPKLADAIVDTFKLDTLQVIDTTPERLREVHLIGPARYTEIVAAWQVHQEIRQLMVLLQGAGVSPTHAPRIAHHFRTVRREAHDVADVLDIVQEHPYRLTEVYGIGFTTADKLALWLGLPERSPERLRAALLHALETAAVRDGQCFLFERQLLHRTLQNLRDETLAELLPDQLGVLVASGSVVVQDVPRDGRLQAAVFTPRLHAAEVSVAARIARLRSATTRLASIGPWRGGGPLPVFDSALVLAPAQETAARMALTEPVSVLTGGPGCGKSFTVKTIVDLVEAAGGRVGLAAPTGRAAKRLQNLTGRTATTVHRMIGNRRDDDTGPLNLFDAWDPLEADLIVIDEASMLDLPLLDRLLGKLTPGVHLLLVGDVHQLPSVGPGQVLRDLLAVDAIPRTELDEVFRQSADSAIIRNAAQIRHGQPIRSGGDFWFLPVPDPEIPATVVDLVTRRLPTTYGITPDDVQVLAPSTKGPAGTQELAAAIQAKVNPHHDGQAQHWGDGRPFRLNDRVIAVRNDLRKGVLNGSTGRVTAIDDKDRHIHVTLDDDGSTILYAFEELDELLHAYAITVHRAQGSEYPHVIVPLTKTGPSYLLLRRNLLYTAVTRARQMLVLVGDPEALDTAIKQPAAGRNSSLAVRLHEALTSTAVLPDPVRTNNAPASLY